MYSNNMTSNKKHSTGGAIPNNSENTKNKTKRQ